MKRYKYTTEHLEWIKTHYKVMNDEVAYKEFNRVFSACVTFVAYRKLRQRLGYAKQQEVDIS